MEKTFDVNQYERPSVTVDVLLFTIDEDKLKIVLVKRNEEPFRDSWALPGGFVRISESLDEAAKRELKEEAGVEGVYLEQLYTFGEVKRDPRMRVITVTYLALASKQGWNLKASGDVKEVKIFDIEQLPSLAFDHQQIFEYGLERLRGKLSYTNIVLGLLPDDFTLTQLQKVYETILKSAIDKRNFRKKMLASGLLVSAGKKVEGSAHRPAMLYSFKDKRVIVTD